MNLYELAKQVTPSSLADHESKVIWSGNRGMFAYLIRLDDAVFLRMSFSQAQLEFFTLIIEDWDIATFSSYKEIAELWQIEKESLTRLKPSSGQLF